MGRRDIGRWWQAKAFRRPGAVTPAVVAALVAALWLTGPAVPVAHEIPTDVTVQAFVKPQDTRLYLLVRVPLEAMRDVQFPTWGQDYLDVARADDRLREAATLWIANYVELYEDGMRLPAPEIRAIRASLPSDRSFGTYEDAFAHVTTGARLPDDLELYWQQALLDVLLAYPIRSERSELSIRPGFEWLGLRVTTVLRFLPPGGEVRAFQFHGDPGLFRLDPRWHQAALRFVQLGFAHILEGVDHLLFLLCLVIPFRRLGALVAIVTSFTVAHSMTLIAAAYEIGPDALWFPPLIETLIAASIVYMALENIVGAGLRRRWLITFGFGLVHGFGFSFALRESLQFAGAHLLTSLLSFNVGVELGQLLVLGVLLPALALIFRFAVAERIGTVILSALIAHTGWHWMTERLGVLREFPRPTLDALLLATLMRWLMAILILAAVAWLVHGLLRQPAKRPREQEPVVGAEK